MRYEVVHGNETFHVQVKELGGSVYEVQVNEDPSVHIDAMKTPLTGYSVLVGAKQYEGSVHELEDGTFDVHVGTSAFDFRVIDERRKALIGTSVHAATGKQEVHSQMPGKIVKLLVRVGQEVESDEGLIIVEAMKMENELRSPIAGVVTRIAVEEGDTVETDALLIVVEPPEED